jgi:hypothetical protein
MRQTGCAVTGTGSPEGRTRFKRLEGWVQLDELFETWLFTAGKPGSATVAGRSRIARPSTQRARKRAGTWVDEVQRRLEHGRY